VLEILSASELYDRVKTAQTLQPFVPGGDLLSAHKLAAAGSHVAKLGDIALQLHPELRASWKGPITAIALFASSATFADALCGGDLIKKVAAGAEVGVNVAQAATLSPLLASLGPTVNTVGLFIIGAATIAALYDDVKSEKQGHDVVAALTRTAG
jgi:uncharacterized protein YfiM (DUF2279 family)